MTFRPLHDRVAIRRLEGEGTSKGGIIIPETAAEKPQQGEVVAVGAGGRDSAGHRIAPALAVGDRVVFGKWSGTELKIDGEDVLIMTEGDVMLITDTGSAARPAA
jgi:chaperonin GroES